MRFSAIAGVPIGRSGADTLRDTKRARIYLGIALAPKHSRSWRPHQKRTGWRTWRRSRDSTGERRSHRGRRSCCHLHRDSGSAEAVHSLQVSEFVGGGNSHFGAGCLEGIRLVAAVAPVQSGDSTSEGDPVAQRANVYTEKHMRILDCSTSLMLDITFGLRLRETFSYWRSVRVVHHQRP